MLEHKNNLPNVKSIAGINCIFIDHDNTLIDLETILAKKLDGLFALSGEKATDILLREIHDRRIHKEFQDRHSDIGLHSKLLLEHLDIPYDQQFADKVTGRIKEAFLECLRNPVFFQDSLSFLDGVNELGLRLYLTTANLAREKVEALERCGSRKYFVSGYDEVTLGQRKLDRAFYEEALNRSRSSALETVVVGDSVLDDVLPAEDAGIATIWLNRNGGHEGRQIADFEVSNLKEALLLLTEFEHRPKYLRFPSYFSRFISHAQVSTV